MESKEFSDAHLILRIGIPSIYTFFLSLLYFMIVLSCWIEKEFN